jgi:hypothetical protein
MNHAGACLAQMTISHTPEGFLKLDESRIRLGVEPADCVVGLETAHNVLVDFLWGRGYDRIYVVPPNVVKSNRSRYQQSGAPEAAQVGLAVAERRLMHRSSRGAWSYDFIADRTHNERPLRMLTGIDEYTRECLAIRWEGG